MLSEMCNLHICHCQKHDTPFYVDIVSKIVNFKTGHYLNENYSLNETINMMPYLVSVNIVLVRNIVNHLGSLNLSRSYDTFIMKFIMIS